MGESDLLSDPPAGMVFAPGPQRQTRHRQLIAGPIDQCSTGLGGEASTSVVGADPVVQLGGVSALSVEAGYPKRVSALSFDHSEMKHAVVAPRLLVAPGHRERALRRWFARPRHPGQQLGSGRDDGGVQAISVRGAHWFQQQALRFER